MFQIGIEMSAAAIPGAKSEISVQSQTEPATDASPPSTGPNYCYFCERSPGGQIRRSSSARRAFKELHPCASTGKSTGPCPGYVIDHVIPLGRGGEDQPGNMQWQTREEAAAKDRVE